MPDYGPRIRAARGWANISQEQLAEALGRNKQFVADRERAPNEDRWREPTKGDRIAIAAICGVPPEFLEVGFDGHAPSELSERLADLEKEIRHLVRELALRDMEEPAQSDESDQQGEGQ
jgi:transcriptional regulator with XRE-family HTH domain